MLKFLRAGVRDVEVVSDDYYGHDLEAMVQARNYHRWIFDEIEPFLGRRIVEVGAGTGSFSALMLDRPTESLSLVEPSPGMYAQLEGWLAERCDARASAHRAFFGDVAATIGATQRPDTVLYINVLEHVEHDGTELRIARDVLEPGGRLIIFVPALPWLHGRFDDAVGHHRRYVKRQLEALCVGAGFRVVHSRYFDVAGILPWWLKYRVLRSARMEGSAVKLYDRLVVPVMRRVESVVRPPLGKNIVLIAEAE
jgi:SAM-dependent methyltransferase